VFATHRLCWIESISNVQESMKRAVAQEPRHFYVSKAPFVFGMEDCLRKLSSDWEVEAENNNACDVLQSASK
jgi:hypothetical protein